MAGEMDVHIVLDDPAGNSYLQVKDTLLSQMSEVQTHRLLCCLICNELICRVCLQNVYAPDPDPEMTTEKYARTFEQNEDLGLNDMKTEGYQE